MKISAAVLICLFILTGNLNAEIKLTFGVYSSDKPTQMVHQFRPILNHLEAAISQQLKEPVHIRLQIFSNYEKGIKAIADGQVDFTRLGPASYVFAKQLNHKISVIAVEKHKGEKTFKGIICVHKNSPISSISDLRGKSFAFGNVRSTIGRYLSQNFLYSHHISASDLADYKYLGRHDAVGMAVALGQYDAGTLKEATYNKFLKKGVALKKISEFNNVTKPWVAGANLPQEITGKIRQILLDLTDETILKNYGKDGFLPGSDSDYQTTRQAIIDNPLFFNAKGGQVR